MIQEYIHGDVKIPLTVKINSSLAQEISSLKQQYAQQGKYFSVTQPIEIAIERALVQGKKGLV